MSSTLRRKTNYISQCHKKTPSSQGCECCEFKLGVAAIKFLSESHHVGIGHWLQSSIAESLNMPIFASFWWRLWPWPVFQIPFDIENLPYIYILYNYWTSNRATESSVYQGVYRCFSQLDDTFVNGWILHQMFRVTLKMSRADFWVGHCPRVVNVYIADWKITMFNGKINYFYGHVQ